MSNVNSCAVILAGGQGKRMKSELPKPMFEVLGEPMLKWVMSACEKAGVDDMCVVTGYNSEVIEKRGQEFYDKEVAGAIELVAAHQAKGYEIACYTYDNIGYGGKSATDIKEDMAKWEKDIMPVVGTLDTFVYAQKSDISSTGAYTGNKFNVLHDMGFRYFISNGNKPACTVTNTYVRQLRVMVTGTAMAHTGTMYSDFFDAKTVLDSTRGDVPQA